jgi:alpha-amylase
MALSLLCRRRGDPPAARRAIGRAQCNDAYWHGVFGGLYLPHLREAIWSNLAWAESELRRGEALGVEVLDLDGDGHDEIWIHSDQFSALLSPRRGAALEEYTVFAGGMNYANTLTRRREAYHDTALEQHAETQAGGDGAPSIHDIEEGLRLEHRPPLDTDPRAILVDRVLPAGLTLDQYAGGDYRPAHSWAQTPASFTIERQPDTVEIVCSFSSPDGAKTLEKRFEFAADGMLKVSYRWDAAVGQPDDLFAPELSLFAPLELRSDPEAEIWTFPIETVAKSERGFDRTRQGDSVTPRWPVHLGQARVELAPERLAEKQELQSSASTLAT